MTEDAAQDGVRSPGVGILAGVCEHREPLCRNDLLTTTGLRTCPGHYSAKTINSSKFPNGSRQKKRGRPGIGVAS